MIIHRDETRSILHDHFEEEFDARFVGAKAKLFRRPLYALGPMHQIHSDGHEKLGSQALQLGGNVGIDYYGYKDQFSSLNPMMRVVPNSRDRVVIAHLYLDFVIENGYRESIQR